MGIDNIDFLKPPDQTYTHPPAFTPADMSDNQLIDCLMRFNDDLFNEAYGAAMIAEATSRGLSWPKTS